MANALEDIRNAIWLLEHNEINREQYENLIRKWCDAEPIRHAHWEDCSNGWMCSECHRDNLRDTKYCPHCGAKMDGKINTESVRRGHWVYKKDMGYFCSACMEDGLSPTNADDNCGYSLDGTMNYCWNCGAKMDKVTE